MLRQDSNGKGSACTLVIIEGLGSSFANPRGFPRWLTLGAGGSEGGLAWLKAEMTLMRLQSPKNKHKFKKINDHDRILWILAMRIAIIRLRCHYHISCWEIQKNPKLVLVTIQRGRSGRGRGPGAMAPRSEGRSNSESLPWPDFPNLWAGLSGSPCKCRRRSLPKLVSPPGLEGEVKRTVQKPFFGIFGIMCFTARTKKHLTNPSIILASCEAAIA